MKSTIAIIDGNTSHRTQMMMALQGEFSVRWYDNLNSSRSAMHLELPQVFIIGQTIAGGGSGLSLIRELQGERMFASIPVLFIADRDDSRTRDQLLLMGIKSMLTKPYSIDVLRGTVLKLVNAAVMATWKDLEPLQRKTLEGTLAAFDGIANDLAKGKPPEIGPVTEACSAVVEVMAREELGNVLEKIRSHDNFTYVHSMRFSAFMAVFAKSIGLPKDLQIQVASGGLLHDIGMMSIPSAVLNKQDQLTPVEWKQVRNHVQTSQKIIQMMGNVGKGIGVIVSQHHERLDGSGYPHGLRGGELNELARMAAIIDVFCGLTDRRPYRRTLSAHAAFEQIATTMKGLLDIELMMRFREVLLDTQLTDADLDEVG